MVDFIKIITRNFNTPSLEAHSALNFVGSYYCETGEAIPNKKAQYKGMEFILYDNGLLKIQGSIHKYKNDGLHNHDDFTFMQIAEVLTDLQNRFNLTLSDCVLKNFEVGINVQLKDSPKSILNRLLTHKNLAFKDVSRSGGHIKQAEHAQYIFKVYDKGRQYNLKHPCLRTELKFVRMQKLNNIGLFNLADLLKKSTYSALESLLINEWNNLLLFEKPLNSKLLSPLERDRKQYQWANPEYWLSISKQERNRQRKTFRSYITKRTVNEHLIVAIMIENKFTELISAWLPIYDSIIV